MMLSTRTRCSRLPHNLPLSFLHSHLPPAPTHLPPTAFPLTTPFPLPYHPEPTQHKSVNLYQAKELPLKSTSCDLELRLSLHNPLTPGFSGIRVIDDPPATPFSHPFLFFLFPSPRYDVTIVLPTINLPSLDSLCSLCPF